MRLQRELLCEHRFGGVRPGVDIEAIIAGEDLRNVGGHVERADAQAPVARLGVVFGPELNQLSFCQRSLGRLLI